MYQGSIAGASHIKTDDKFEVEVVEAPQFEGKKQAVIQQGQQLMYQIQSNMQLMNL